MPLVRRYHSDARTNPLELAGEIHDAIVAIWGNFTRMYLEDGRASVDRRLCSRQLVLLV